MHFLGYYISAPMGCCALKFLHMREIDQSYLAHAPKNFNRENLKINGLKFSVCTAITSGLVAVSSQIFIQTTCSEPRVITWIQFLEGLPPKIWEGKKPSKIWRDFWQLSALIANISRTDPQMENRKSSWSTTTPPTLNENKIVNFGPQTKKLLTCILTHPSEHFSGDYISALRGAAPWNFYTR